MTHPETTETASAGLRRIGWLDAARGLALLAMATYHLTWDFEYFGYLEPGTAGHGFPKAYARLIASTFLLLAGFGLALGHRGTIRWDRFWWRFAKVAGAAALITVATLYFMPQGYIHFGILHEIALASLIGLAFLNLPPLITFAAAAVVLVLPSVFRSDIFDHPLLWWTGLAPQPPVSFDFVPIFPWLSVVMTGIGLGSMAGVRTWLAGLPAPAPLFRPFAFLGRHSLLVYLLHQIPLFGLVWLLSMVAPPDRATTYTRECMRTCTPEGSQQLCEKFCGCTLERLEAGNMLEPLQTGKIRIEDERIQSMALQCSAEAQK